MKLTGMKRLAGLMLCLTLLCGMIVLPAAAQEKTYDFGGITVSLCNYWGKDLTPGQNDETDRFIARVAELEKKYNVKFEYRKGPEDYYDNMVTTIMAGEPYGDLMFAFPWVFSGWVNAGAVKDITGLTEELGLDLKGFNPAALEEGTLGGKLYGLNKEKAEINSMIAFNKRLVEEAGLESPYDLLARGEWNFEALQKYAKAMTKFDANGVNTQWGLSAFDAPWLAVSMIYANNGSVVDYSGETPAFSMDSANSLEALNLAAQMANVDKSIFVTELGAEWDTAVKMFTGGQIGMLRAEQWIIECFNAWSMEDDFGLVPFPMGPQATGHIDDISSQAVYFIPSNVDDEHAKAALLFYNDLFDDLYPELSQEDKAVTKFTRYCRDEESVAQMANIYYNGLTKSTGIYKAGVTAEDVVSIVNAIYAGTSTPAAIIAEKKPAIQAAIDEIYKK